MALAQPIIFISILVIAIFLVSDRVNSIIYNIKLGRDEKINSDFSFRLKSVLLIALGQKKMFKRPIPALLHLAIYGAFIITQIELIEIVIDGLTGKHRSVWSLMNNWIPTKYLYTITINMIELASLGALIATFVFLWRRNALKLPRFHNPEMKGWPTLDANLILIFEIFLVSFIMLMNGGDQALQRMGAEHYHHTGLFLVSYPISSLLELLPMDTVMFIERFGWWSHIILVMIFLVYVTYSKHLHIILAFPNTYFTRPEPHGKMTNMPAIQKEVASMLGDTQTMDGNNEEEIPSFGAKDITDLSWKQLMEAYTCTECGRCTSSCPANITGKKLSPRKIMMDTRDRMEELGEYKRQNGPNAHDGKSLITDYITKGELRACTTCNACVEECPINISPLGIIIELRRSLIMEASDSPQEWNTMFTNMENNQAAWQFAADDRLKWTEELNA